VWRPLVRAGDPLGTGGGSRRRRHRGE